MEALCFDVKAPFASFRVPATTRGFLTFPFPPRTTILGLIGAILGIERNEIYFDDHPLNDSKLAIIMNRLPLSNNLRTNQMQTKSPITIHKSFKIFLPKNLNRGVRSPQSLTLLNDVHYRILVQIEEKNKKELNELKTRILDRKYSYTPYLGRANYLASLDYIDTIELESHNNIKKSIPICSLCSSNSVKKATSGNFTIISNVPMSYNAERHPMKGILLEPRFLANIIYFFDSIDVIPSDKIFTIENAKMNELNGKNIIFLPNHN